VTKPLANEAVLLTPAGSGAIGVIRVTGPDAHAIIAKVFRPTGGAVLSPSSTSGVANDLPLNRPRYGSFVDEDETIDDVVVCRVGAAPDAIEVMTHGGVRVMERVLRSLERMGAPFADEAHATGVAWSSHSKIESEALSLLHLAKTERAVRFLLWQRQHLPEHLRRFMSCRPFVHEDAAEMLAAMLDGYKAACRLIHGGTVALLGPPNTGKSTLFNRLLTRDVTVVSPQPGTTRDWIASPLELAGTPLTLVDTAGRRQDVDRLEQLAIDMGRTVAGAADLHVIVLDGSRAGQRAWTTAPEPNAIDVPRLLALNKMDLVSKSTASDCEAQDAACSDKAVRVSARTGEGIEELTDVIGNLLELDRAIETQPCVFTERQRALAARALSDLPTSSQEAVNTFIREFIGK